MSGITNSQTSELRLRDLRSHIAPYVTVDDLARYWQVSRKQIYKQIGEGKLPAIRLGPRSLRIRTRDATEFELRSTLEWVETERSFSGASPNQWSHRPSEHRFGSEREAAPGSPGDKSKKVTKIVIKRP
jgi:excisionase family DNA binding protein